MLRVRDRLCAPTAYWSDLSCLAAAVAAAAAVVRCSWRVVLPVAAPEGRSLRNRSRAPVRPVVPAAAAAARRMGAPGRRSHGHRSNIGPGHTVTGQTSVPVTRVTGQTSAQVIAPVTGQTSAQLTRVRGIPRLRDWGHTSGLYFITMRRSFEVCRN